MFVRGREISISIMILILIIGNSTIPLPSETPNRNIPLKIMEMSDDPLTIVFDMGHGQYSEYIFSEEDTWLANNLTDLGYNVVWAWGGLNDTILENATGLVIGAIYGTTEGFTSAEYAAVDDWFNAGEKFFWVGSDSDYAGYAYINNNASAMLELAGSHVYPEPASISDTVSSCNASYRVVANRTSDDAFVSPIVEGVSDVLMHGPTLLYGSNSMSPGEGVEPVALESTTLEYVHPLLYYSENATIGDSDLVPPVAHNDGDQGSFVCATMETHLGPANSGIVVVSGASPYGDYMPMSTPEYYSRSLDGNTFVIQTIDYGIKLLGSSTINSPADIVYEEGMSGNFIEWKPFASSPKSYNITLDDVLFKEGLWNSSDEIISVAVDGLSTGIHNYTLQVINDDNETSSDEVVVTVYPQLLPTINHPEDITYYVGSDESVIVWTPDDFSLYYFQIFKDDELILTHYWGPDDSTIVSLYVGELPVGVHNYTICVYDRVSLFTTDIVIVEVLAEITTTTTITSTTTTTNSTTGYTSGDILDIFTLVISIGSTLVIVIVIVLIYKSRT